MIEPVDPITTEVVAHYLIAASEEMGTALIKAAFSTAIKERADCSTGIFDPEGDIIAQAQRCPIHLGSMIGTINRISMRFDPKAMKPGDMYAANDPYNGGGSHLPDITIVAPVFSKGELVAYVANIAHHSDIGGMVPGSLSSICTSIFQEGIRIPPVRLMSEGEIDQSVFDIILLNSRVPDERDGDLRAQFASNFVGCRAVEALFERFGISKTRAAIASYLNFTERRIRAGIAGLKPGVYEASDFVAGNNENELAEIKLKLTVSADEIVLDFTETATQLKASRNVTFQALNSTVYSMIKAMVDPDVPANAGCFRPIRIVTKPGTIVEPLPPSAVGLRLTSCTVVGDVISMALSQAMPDKALASCGSHQQLVLSGTDNRTGRFFVNHETLAGGLGARPYKDGMDAVRVPVSGAANLPIEVLEHSYPLRVERYALRDESGGVGSYVGGFGVVRDYRILGDNVTVAITSGRQQAPATGLTGGGSGARGEFVLNPGTPSEKVLPSAVAAMPLPKGSLLRVCTPGGGGYGAASERSEDLVSADIRDGRFSSEGAQRFFSRKD